MKCYLTLSFLLSLLALEAQDYQTAIYQAFLKDQMDSWHEVINQMEDDYAQTHDPDLLYELLESEYGYTGWLVQEKKKDEAKELLEIAERHIALLTDQELDNARVYSLKGAFYGFQIMLEPARAPKLGRLSMEANEKAMELDSGEPQVWLEKANMDYYRPVIFGGSKRKAVPMYEKAVELFESSPGRTRKNWVYLNSLVGLATAYENTKKYSEAGSVYRKILELEPSYKLVNEELYPKFREKHPGK